MKFGEMSNADKVMNPQHIGRDLADINLALQIGIRDNLVKILA